MDMDVCLDRTKACLIYLVRLMFQLDEYEWKMTAEF